MTDDIITEPVEEGESESGEDTSLVKDLRKQIRDLQRDLKAVPNRSDLEANIRASVAREKAIESELVALKLPSGLLDTVEGKMGGAEVNRESVVAALTAIGFDLTESTEGGEESAPAQQDAENLAGVANLASQVANAANQQTTDNLTDKINAAQTPEELANLMREAGMAN